MFLFFLGSLFRPGLEVSGLRSLELPRRESGNEMTDDRGRQSDLFFQEADLEQHCAFFRRRFRGQRRSQPVS